MCQIDIGTLNGKQVIEKIINRAKQLGYEDEISDILDIFRSSDVDDDKEWKKLKGNNEYCVTKYFYPEHITPQAVEQRIVVGSLQDIIQAIYKIVGQTTNIVYSTHGNGRFTDVFLNGDCIYHIFLQRQGVSK